MDGSCDVAWCNTAIDAWLALNWYYEASTFTECANCNCCVYPNRVTSSQAQYSSFNFPRGVFLDSQNNMFIAEESNRRIRKISSTGASDWLAQVASVVNNKLLLCAQEWLYLPLQDQE